MDLDISVVKHQKGRIRKGRKEGKETWRTEIAQKRLKGAKDLFNFFHGKP
jgi:hypothetical protein